MFARFRAERSGAAAVEFALIAIPFFLLLFGIMEIAMVFLLATSLENATMQAARAIRTGQSQSAGTATAASFKTDVCNRLGWLKGDCATNLSVDVRTFSTFQSVQMQQPIKNGAFDSSALTFAAGGPGDIVLVRTFYKWPFVTPLIGSAMKQLNDGSMLVVSVASFRNEPYGS
ncbi:MAG: TadE/TadG family type IV pilus assembly protein [Caulobacteraceae bacterium]